MMYLHLKFKNAGLLSYRKGMSGRSASPHFMYNQKVIGDTVTDTKSRGHDLTNPIPYTLLSNVLHCLCGEIPVPTKRKSIFTRNEKLDEIAKNSWFHFENELIFDKFGNPAVKEIFQTQKVNPNSPLGVKSSFKLFNGEIKEVNGFYSWAYFDKMFLNNKVLYKNYIDIIQKYIGVNPHSLNMNQIVFELSKFWNNKTFINDVIDFQKNNKTQCGWNEVFFDFNIKIVNNQVVIDRTPSAIGNSNWKSKTPSVCIKGISYITPMNGDIICQINDENIINKIKNGEGFARFLEGGYIYVDSIDFFEPIPNFKDSFKPIFSHQNQYNPLINSAL